ncbi:MAG: hypothetical protein AABW79_00735 [Nanoarchaeota archaeon]
MEVKERTRQEIEARLGSMGDYVKIDYLQRALGTHLDFDTRKFVLTKLSAMYEDKGMLLEAGKLMKSAAEINTTFKGKIQDYMKTAELYVRGTNFQDADLMLAQALALGNEREKIEIKSNYKKFYSDLAQFNIKRDKRQIAKKAYEKYLTLDLNAIEKKEAQDQLLKLYEKLGNIRDFYRLRDGHIQM